MRNTFLLSLVALLFFTRCNQPSNTNTQQKDSIVAVPLDTMAQANEMERVIHAFVKAYEEKSNAQANALINSDLGLTVIYRPGVSDTFSKINSLDFSKPMPDHYLYPTLKNNYPLSYGRLPVYDCGTEKWNKVGLYCDTISRPNQLSTIIAFESEFEPKKYPKGLIKEVANSEKESYRIILTGDNPLIFHIQQYNGDWYVTVLDRAYAGCDA